MADLPVSVFVSTLCPHDNEIIRRLVSRDESPSLRDTWPTILILARLPWLKISLLLGTWDKFSTCFFFFFFF